MLIPLDDQVIKVPPSNIIATTIKYLHVLQWGHMTFTLEQLCIATSPGPELLKNDVGNQQQQSLGV